MLGMAESDLKIVFFWLTSCIMFQLKHNYYNFYIAELL